MKIFKIVIKIFTIIAANVMCHLLNKKNNILPKQQKNNSSLESNRVNYSNLNNFFQQFSASSHKEAQVNYYYWPSMNL